MNELGWIDSHAHLCEDNFKEDIDMVINNAINANVKRIMVIVCGLDQVDHGLALKKQYDIIDLALGIHPEDADEADDQMLVKLDLLLATKAFVAVGEIGLDYYWRKDNKVKQQALFDAQLKLANKHQLPVLVHSREAAQDTYTMLKAANVVRKGVMHCYSGSVEMAKEYVKLGYLISLAGPVTFKNAVLPVAVAKQLDIKDLLIETDSPFMAPVPKRGKRNEPAYVRFVGEYISALKGIDEAEFIKQLHINYQSLIG